MTDEGIDIRASIAVLEDVCLQEGTGITVEFDGTFYPSRIVECATPITVKNPGQAVIGIIYFARMPRIEAGAQLGLMDGPTRRVATATVLEVKR